MGNNSSRQVTAQDKAILDLKTQRDKLHQYQKRITILTDRETQIAKQMLAQGDKKRALLALRRKKYQDSLLSKTDGQLEQLEKLTSSVEFALIQKDVLYGLQQGTKVLKEIHAEMGGIEHVEKLMGETADAIAYQKVCIRSADGIYPAYVIPSMMLTAGAVQEVSEMLGGKISNQDEEEVEDELEALEAEIRGVKQIPDVPLPAVPDTEPERQAAEAEQLPAGIQQEERQAVLA
jgi:charged multivesicular body protein 6